MVSKDDIRDQFIDAFFDFCAQFCTPDGDFNKSDFTKTTKEALIRDCLIFYMYNKPLVTKDPTKMGEIFGATRMGFENWYSYVDSGHNKLNQLSNTLGSIELVSNEKGKLELIVSKGSKPILKSY